MPIKYRVIPCYLHIPVKPINESFPVRQITARANKLGCHLTLDGDHLDRITTQPIKSRKRFDALPEAKD
jgi:hypothetical protein